MANVLTAHAGKQHEKHFGWKTFRVLTVTTDQHRMQSMMEALRKLRIPHSPGAPLFFFTTATNCTPLIRLCMSGAMAMTGRRCTASTLQKAGYSPIYILKVCCHCANLG
jgi:hypothetical protein